MPYGVRLDDRQALSIREWSACLGTSEQDTRRKIKDGTIRAVRYGARIKIPRSELDRVLKR
jgi:excisionase family DNA binding protein